jgi:hypothetical protein
MDKLWCNINLPAEVEGEVKRGLELECEEISLPHDYDDKELEQCEE